MRRRYILAAAIPSVLLSACSNSKPVKQPNILFIMTDDHSAQSISAYGSSLIQTPNIDRIADEGIRFDNCYVTNSISGPSRACILTGKFGHINGFTDNSQTFNGDQLTYPKVLQQNGYQTALIGKWHLNSDPQGFDHWAILPGQGDYYQPEFIENGEKKVEQGYVTDIITQKTISFIENRDKSKPFSILCYHKAPHRNWMPAQRHLNAFENTVFPEPQNLFDDYQNRGPAAHRQMMEIDKHMWLTYDLKIATGKELDRAKSYEALHKTDVNKADVMAANRQGDELQRLKNVYDRMTKEEKQRWNARYEKRVKEFQSKKRTPEELVKFKYQCYMQDYLGTILSVDESIGELLLYLEKIGELDNTIIVYTSDQGFFLGEHGWFDKRFMYEESLRMPLVIRYPSKIKAKSTTNALTMNIDFAPTLLDMAGIEVPKEMQGASLNPVFKSNGKTPKKWREAVYYHYYEYPSWHMVMRHYGMRTDRYKLIHFYNDEDYWEMYDLQNDPHEMSNIYGQQQYADTQEKLHKQLLRLQKDYKDTDPTERHHEFFKGVEQLH